MKKKLLALFVLLSGTCLAQINIDTLAIQDFEVTPMTPTWTFTGPVIYNASGTSSASAAPPSSPIGIGGSRAWETTTNSGGLQLVFSNITIPAGYDSVRVHFNLAAMNLIGSTGGPDNLDWVMTEVSLDGGTTWYNRLRIRGAVNDNSFWAYSATGVAKVYYQPATEALYQPTTTGLQTTFGYSNCEIVFPGSVTQVRVRITARSSSSTDTWLVDNVVITGENNCANSTSSITASACDSYTAPSGAVFTTSGTHTDVIPNAAGCDSTITINLTITPGSASSITTTVCDSYTAPSGAVFTTSGTHTDVIPNAAGCDSTITINLTVNASATSTIGANVCDGYNAPSGAVYLASGTYMDTIPTVAGCDSVITINLTVRNSTSSTLTVTSCGPYVLPGGSTATTSGTYNDLIANAVGCDSAITVNLTVITVDTSTTVVNETMTANAGGAAYAWIDCSNGNVLATTQSYMAVANGTYAVIVTQNGCTDTSSCILILSTGMDENGTLQPTLLTGELPGTFTVTFPAALTQAAVTITDMQGRMIRNDKVSGTSFPVDLSEHAAGLYLLEVRNGGQVVRVKLVRR